jgi:hypothetical protein
MAVSKSCKAIQVKWSVLPKADKFITQTFRSQTLQAGTLPVV